MISVEVDRIPEFLREGSFYKALDKDEQQSQISVPANCYVDKEDMNDLAEFARMLDVMSFWGLYKIPLSLLVFCGQTESDVWSGLLEERIELDFAQALLSIFHPDVSFEKAIELEIDEAVDCLVDKYVYGVYPDGVIYSALAAKKGRLDYLTLLHDYGHPFDETACEKAASNGHLECLKFLHEIGCPMDRDVHFSAASAGHLLIIQWATKNGLKIPEGLAEHVASRGQLAILRYLVENGTVLRHNVAKEAAKAGHIDCLRYLLEVNCPVDFTATEAAVVNGNLECLKLLHQHSGSAHWDTKIIGSAAINGQFACLQYLHENGCPWDERTTNSAAGAAHFECLRYAIENNCPYEADLFSSCIYTVVPSSVQCLEYLSIALEHLWQRVADDGSLFKRAFLWGNYYAVEYLISREHPYMYWACTEIELRSVLYTKMLSPDLAKYDGNLAKCIDCLIANNWNIVTNGESLRRVIAAHENDLPVCTALMSLIRGASLA